ncbi:CocE/NonD family hydrolase [Lentzea sp. NPDC051213]|uniref:CocE/NonD family hydrolase n=1 Tax=Lentzea sp. NPDC051213 TaxID=3364126 RepID=UPI0037A50B31
MAKFLTAVHRKVFGLPPGGVPYTVERGLEVPAADGASLLTDVYRPVGEARGTVLIRTPYGRGLPVSLFHGRAFADHGYQVVLQSVRGTAGSTGEFRPMAQESSDAQDTVAWLRQQPWFTGRLATFGGSYLGWTQWALLQDPPPELRASVVLVGPHDFSRALHGTGSLALADFLLWSAMMKAREKGGLRALLAVQGRLKTALRSSSPGEAARVALGDEPTWFSEWLSHPDLDDPFWEPYNATPALAATKVPTLLISGWHDVFLDQTLEQFGSLADAALTIGPWTHLDTTAKSARVTDVETLAWFDQHVADLGATREARVRLYQTGANLWRGTDSWPARTGGLKFALRPDGRLGEHRRTGTVAFNYDPADPTPSLGGRHMSPKAGRRDNRPLESRADVITFTSGVLEAPFDVFGAPEVELVLDATSSRPDLFVRLCDVDSRGRSWNVAETFSRVESGTVRLTLGSCSHRFRAGHRIRLQISGGAYPRFARNPEAGEYTIDCAGSSVTLPTG